MTVRPDHNEDALDWMDSVLRRIAHRDSQLEVAIEDAQESIDTASHLATHGDGRAIFRKHFPDFALLPKQPEDGVPSEIEWQIELAQARVFLSALSSTIWDLSRREATKDQIDKALADNLNGLSQTLYAAEVALSEEIHAGGGWNG